MKLRLAIACAAVVSALTSHASAARPWVDRPMTLPRFGLSIDAGLGIAHYGPPFLDPALTGVGLNFEGAFGITSDLEIGLRTGVRFGTNGEYTRADQYGRLFDTETYGTGTDAFANPELHIRYRAVNAHVVELGLEARAYLPFEAHTAFGVMAGLPLALHLGRIVRLDTGVYIPVIFYGNDRLYGPDGGTALFVSVPARLWFQATSKFWLGPITEFRFHNGPFPPAVGRGGEADILLGFGLGYSFSRYADFKTQFILPRVNGDGRDFGLGAGIGLNFY